MRNDQDLKHTIEQRLRGDHLVSQHAIDVAVRSGVVTLHGVVDSYRRKLRAHALVTGVAGVVSVDNMLHVRPPSPSEGRVLAERVRAALDAHPDVPKEVITVAAQAGKVTVSGSVYTSRQRRLVADVVLSVRGVGQVVNLLLVDVSRWIEDQALSRNIQHALSVTEPLAGKPIRVAVAGDAAVLSGTVKNGNQKRLAESVVRRFRVRRVRNEILVRGRGRSSATRHVVR
jgi:osmotically-inducible protein OsmY